MLHFDRQERPEESHRVAHPGGAADDGVFAYAPGSFGLAQNGLLAPYGVPLETLVVFDDDDDIDTPVRRVGTFEQPIQVLDVGNGDIAANLEPADVVAVGFDAAHVRRILVDHSAPPSTMHAALCLQATALGPVRSDRRRYTSRAC